MTRELFDQNLRSLRRDRAARRGTEMVIYNRVFEDCLDRLQDMSRRFGRALLVGCPSPAWPDRLKDFARVIDVVDPGRLFAIQAGGTQVEEDRHDFGEDRYDLCIAIGTLDSVNDLPLALQLIRRALRPGGLLIGAISGGENLPMLRASLVEAGRADGKIIARTHPRIAASSLAQLLSAAGLSMPVVDVDRVKLRYVGVDDLVRDLRAMGATSVLFEQGPPFSKSGAQLLRHAFAARAHQGKIEEIVEILHFLGWNQ